MSQPASDGVWEVERPLRRIAQPPGHRSPATVRAVAHWRQRCIGTAPRLASAASAVALLSARRWLAGAAPAVRDRLDASSGVPEPWSLAHGVRDGSCLLATGRTQWAARGGGAAARWRKPPRASEFLERCVRRPALEVAMTACSHLTCGHAWAGISYLPRDAPFGARLYCVYGCTCKAGMECFIREYMITKFD